MKNSGQERDALMFFIEGIWVMSYSYLRKQMIKEND